MKRSAVLLLLCTISLCCQPNKGELHLRLVDPAGRTIQGAIQIVSQANQNNARPRPISPTESHATPGRRRKIEQRAQCSRLRRSLPRKCHRTFEKRDASAHHFVLTQTCSSQGFYRYKKCLLHCTQEEGNRSRELLNLCFCEIDQKFSWSTLSRPIRNGSPRMISLPRIRRSPRRPTWTVAAPAAILPSAFKVPA